MRAKPRKIACLVWVAYVLFSGAAGAQQLSAAGKAKGQEILSPRASLMVPIKSLFYTQEEMASIRHALDIYLSRSNGNGESEASLNPLDQNADGSEPLKEYYTYPQFFLESLAYHSSIDWTVRINHQRITKRSRLTGVGSLRILDIDKDKVSFEWKPDRVDLLKMKEIANKPLDDRIDVDYAMGIVDFTLRPNQTFSTYAMQVLEGRVEPVTVKNVKDNAVSDDTGAPEATAVKLPPIPMKNPPAAGNQNGLMGLIDSYRNLRKSNP